MPTNTPPASEPAASPKEQKPTVLKSAAEQQSVPVAPEAKIVAQPPKKPEAPVQPVMANPEKTEEKQVVGHSTVPLAAPNNEQPAAEEVDKKNEISTAKEPLMSESQSPSQPEPEPEPQSEPEIQAEPEPQASTISTEDQNTGNAKIGSVTEKLQNIAAKIPGMQKAHGKLTGWFEKIVKYLTAFSQKLHISEFLQKLHLAKKTDNMPSAEKPADENGGGNVFTKMFGADTKKEEPDDALIEKILLNESQKNKKPGEPVTPDIIDWRDPRQTKQLFDMEEEKTAHAADRLRIAEILAAVACLIPITSFLFSAVFLSPDGILSGLLPSHNYALILNTTNDELEKTKTEISAKTKDVQSFNQKIDDIQNNKILGEIADARISWRLVFETIQSITNRTFEGNEFSRYVTYANYTGKRENSQITVQGEVRNPKGSVWADLIKLKDALNASQYFANVDVNQFTKQLTANSVRNGTLEYTSPFSFQFVYFKDGKEAAYAAAPEQKK